MNERRLKLWHLIITVGIAALGQLGALFLWGGSISTTVSAHELRLSTTEKDVKRIDSDGSAIYKSSTRFTEKEVQEMKQSINEMRREMADNKQLLIQIINQTK